MEKLAAPAPAHLDDPEFYLALREFIHGFARDPGVSWEDVIPALEAMADELRNEMEG